MSTYTLELKDDNRDKDYSYIEIALTPINIFKQTLKVIPNEDLYDKIKLPTEYYSLLKEALIVYDRQEYLNEFISLIPIVQIHYFEVETLIEWGNDPMFRDLIYEFENLKDLLLILNAYFSNNLEELTRISFKLGKNTIAIKNKAIIMEICKSIASAYGFTREGFITHGIEGKGQELSSMQESQRIKKIETVVYLQKIKSLIVKDIIKFLGESNTNMKFAGLFLNICQLRSNNNIPINIKNTLEENLTMQDVDNIRHYNSRY